MKNLYEVYISQINKIINDKNTRCIFLVGSSKNYNLEKEIDKVNDIDLFVISDINEKQIRDIKNINNLDFDINYFSKDKLNEFIDNKEYFFLKEMKNPKIIYDKYNEGNEVISLCKYKYLEGPNDISKDEKIKLKEELIIKIEGLKDKLKFYKFEYEFLTNLYLKDIIVGYFIINNKWIPKDKKLLKEIKKEDESLFILIEKLLKDYKYENLLSIYDYVFKILN